MKIANLYDDHRRVGRNDGASMYSTIALREMGHQVDHLIPDPARLDGVQPYDLSLWVDWGADGLLNMGRLDYNPVLFLPSTSRACWLSDTHLGYEHRLEVAKHFQGKGGHVFCMQKRACEEFKRDGITDPDPVWLPHAFEPQAYFKKNIIKKYDVAFVGHVNSENRMHFLDSMFKTFPNFWYGQRFFTEASEIFNQSKIVINPPIKDDVNMRVFESLGSGSFLLTQDIPTIHELFEDGKHLVLYKTVEEAIEKAKYYLTHDEERNKIAEAGHQEALAKHTYQHRLKVILDSVTQTKEKELCPS